MKKYNKNTNSYFIVPLDYASKLNAVLVCCVRLGATRDLARVPQNNGPSEGGERTVSLMTIIYPLTASDSVSAVSMHQSWISTLVGKA